MTVPDWTEELPFALSTRMEASFEVTDARYDVAIDDLPFLIAPNAQHPYTRRTAPFRRQQIDTSAEPGEQTLSSWWTRSQDSWHRGAGIQFYEPSADDTTKYRFRDSSGVDVWTKGELHLLKRVGASRTVTSGQAALAAGGLSSGVNNAWTTEATTVRRWDGTTATAYSATGGTPGTVPVITGSSVLVGHTAGILSGSTTGSALTALWTIAGGSVVVPYWVKARIIATRDNALYELTLAGGAIGSALYSHPDTSWTWTAVTETPGAILAAGYSSGRGGIYRIALVDGGSAGASPTLGAVSEVAQFPPGEEVHAIRVYLGTYIAIGTSNGLRIGTVNSDGTLQYGPLIISTSNPVRALGARDSYVYAAVQDYIDGNTGCVRVDLSQEIESLRFAYATDFNTGVTGVPASVTFLGNSDRVVIGVTGKGVYLQSATQYVTSAWIKTGNVRYATTEGKLFSRVQVRCSAGSDSTLGIYTVQSGAENFEFSVGNAFDSTEDIALSTSAHVLPDLELKFAFTCSTDGLTSPVLDALNLRAAPQPHIQRIIEYPLSCFDLEKDRSDVPLGGPGTAWQRLAALEARESAKALVTVRDIRTGETYQGLITEVRFINQAPPERSKPNFGGLAIVTVTQV